MMNLLIPLTLLALKLGVGLTYSIPITELTNATDAYEVQESNGNSLRIISPRAEKPTLREIIYYHVIERPYGDTEAEHHKESKSAPEEGPDFDETMRPFTNSHGYQFLDNDSSEKKVEETSNDLVPQKDEDEIIDDVLSVDEVAAKLLQPSDEYYDESEEIILDGSTTTSTEKPKELISSSSHFERSTTPSTTETVLFVNTEPTDNVPTIHIDEATESVVEEQDDVIKDKKAIRNHLFDELRQRYQNSRKPGKSRSRRAADIQDIPEAPRLPELDYSSLPDYFRKTIAPENPESPSVKEIDSDEDYRLDELNEETDFETVVEQSIQKLLTSFKYNEEEQDDGEEDGNGEEDRVDDEEDHVDDEEDHVNEEDQNVYSTKNIKEENAPKTYGMMLSGNSGYVWNDIWSDSGIAYNVGDVETGDESQASNNKPEVPTDSSEPLANNVEDVYTYINKGETRESPYVNDANDQSSGIIPTFRLINFAEELSNEDKEQSKENLEENTTPDKVEQKHSKYTVESKPMNFNNKDILTSHKDEGTQTEENDKPLENQKHNRIHDKPTRGQEKNTEKKGIKGKSDMNSEISKNWKQLESLIEALRDEEFWERLSEWTAIYMDALNKHIKRVVQMEVEKQIKALNLGCHKHKPHDEEVPLDAQKDVIDTDSKQNDNAKKDSLTIDGVEIPVTHNSNFDVDKIDDVSDLLKRRKDKNKNEKPSTSSNDHDSKEHNDKHIEELPVSTPDDKDTEIREKKDNIDKSVPASDKQSEKNNSKVEHPAKVLAQNIYGHSTNNEKVTNIFIFNVNKDVKKLIEDLKPMVDDNKIHTSINKDKKTSKNNITSNFNEHLNNTAEQETNSKENKTAHETSVEPKPHHTTETPIVSTSEVYDDNKDKNSEISIKEVNETKDESSKSSNEHELDKGEEKEKENKEESTISHKNVTDSHDQIEVSTKSPREPDDSHSKDKLEEIKDNENKESIEITTKSSNKLNDLHSKDKSEENKDKENKESTTNHEDITSTTYAPENIENTKATNKTSADKAEESKEVTSTQAPEKQEESKPENTVDPKENEAKEDSKPENASKDQVNEKKDDKTINIKKESNEGKTESDSNNKTEKTKT